MIKRLFDRLTLSESEKKEIRIFYEKYHCDVVRDISRDEYGEFARTGKRIGYEKLFFDRRRRICGTLMMYKAYGDAYLDELRELLRAVCEEYSWALPAHTISSEDPTREIDLFAAETAMMLTEIAYLLSDALPEEDLSLIENEVTDRVISVFETRRFHWETAEHNWSAVCGGCIGMVYLYRNRPVPECIMKAMAAYLRGIGEDGACLEGVQYWSYGFGFYLFFAELLKERTGVDITASDKVRRLARFGISMYMAGGAVNYADCSSDAMPLAGLSGLICSIYPGEIFAPVCKHERVDDCGRLPYYIRSFLYMPVYDTAPMRETIYNKSQIYVYHGENFTFSVKGGCNNEPHNHNDVGSFIVADRTGQLLCELGSGEYVDGYFDDKTRYGFLCCSSLGHNVPVINGGEQRTGAEFACDLFECGNRRARLSIGGAYGAGIKLIREINICDNEIILRDSFENAESITERFISRIEPKIKNNSTFVGGMTVDRAFNVIKTEYTGHDGDMIPIYILECSTAERVFELKISLKSG